MLRDLGQPQVSQDLVDQKMRELSRLVNRLCGWSYPGQPVSYERWIERLQWIGQQVAPQHQVEDWGEDVAIGKVMAYLRAAKSEAELIELVVSSCRAWDLETTDEPDGIDPSD